MTAKAKKTVKIVVDVLLWIFLVFSLLMTILAFTAQDSNGGYPKLGGKCLLTVLSDSMEPLEGAEYPEGWKHFYAGDLIIGEVLDGDAKQQLEKDDVITFYADRKGEGVKELNTHRILIVLKDADGKVTGFRTRGDHEKSMDTYTVKITDVEAKWTGKRFGGLGWVLGFLQSRTGFLVCIVIPLALFFLYELYVMIMTVKKIKNKGKKVISEADEEAIKQRAIEEYLARQAAENNASGDTAENAEAPASDDNKQE